MNMIKKSSYTWNGEIDIIITDETETIRSYEHTLYQFNWEKHNMFDFIETLFGSNFVYDDSLASAIGLSAAVSDNDNYNIYCAIFILYGKDINLTPAEIKFKYYLKDVSLKYSNMLYENYSLAQDMELDEIYNMLQTRMAVQVNGTKDLNLAYQCFKKYHK